MKPGNFVLVTALIGATIFSPTLASADPTLLTILALSAANGGENAAPASPEEIVVVSDADPLGDALAGVFAPMTDTAGGSDVSTGVSYRKGGGYHCHRGHRCHTHR